MILGNLWIFEIFGRFAILQVLRVNGWEAAEKGLVGVK